MRSVPVSLRTILHQRRPLSRAHNLQQSPLLNQPPDLAQPLLLSRALNQVVNPPFIQHQFLRVVRAPYRHRSLQHCPRPNQPTNLPGEQAIFLEVRESCQETTAISPTDRVCVPTFVVMVTAFLYWFLLLFLSPSFCHALCTSKPSSYPTVIPTNIPSSQPSSTPSSQPSRWAGHMSCRPTVRANLCCDHCILIMISLLLCVCLLVNPPVFRPRNPRPHPPANLQGMNHPLCDSVDEQNNRPAAAAAAAEFISLHYCTAISYWYLCLSLFHCVVCLSDCLSLCLTVCLSVCLSDCLGDVLSDLVNLPVNLRLYRLLNRLSILRASHLAALPAFPHPPLPRSPVGFRHQFRQHRQRLSLPRSLQGE